MAATAKMSPWVKVHDERYFRPDNAVVKYDRSTVSSRSYLAGHRGWIAYGPGDDETNYLGFFPPRPRRGGFSKCRVPRKFKTPEGAMRAVDREFPYPAGRKRIKTGRA